MYLTRRDLFYPLLSPIQFRSHCVGTLDERSRFIAARNGKSIAGSILSLSLFQCCIWIVASTVPPTEIQHWGREEGTSVPTNVTLVVFAREKQRLYEVVIINVAVFPYYPLPYFASWYGKANVWMSIWEEIYFWFKKEIAVLKFC